MALELTPKSVTKYQLEKCQGMFEVKKNRDVINCNSSVWMCVDVCVCVCNCVSQASVINVTLFK